MDNFTALKISFMSTLTFDTKENHAVPCACGILVFFPASFSVFILFNLQVKDCHRDYRSCVEYSCPGHTSCMYLCSASAWLSCCVLLARGGLEDIKTHRQKTTALYLIFSIF